MPEMSKRDTFLVSMYKQMWDNIERHIMIVWQSVRVLAGAFAVSALVEKKILSLDFAATIIVLVAAWQVAHTVDAGYWYNRNLAIISNIERQLLEPDDARKIHPYFADKRAPKLLDHLKIQFAFGAAVAVLVLAYHFSQQVYPRIHAPWSTFDIRKTIPYVSFAVCCGLLTALHRHQTQKYTTSFLNPLPAPKQSPQEAKPSHKFLRRPSPGQSIRRSAGSFEWDCGDAPNRKDLNYSASISMHLSVSVASAIRRGFCSGAYINECRGAGIKYIQLAPTFLA